VAAGAFLRPAGHEQRQPGRGHDRGADPLHDPRGDEQNRLDGEAAGHAGHDEDDQPDPEHAGLAEQVREPAAQQQEPPKTTAYPLTSHCSVDVPMCSPAWIEGSATLTIVKSSTTMNCAMASTISRGVPATRPGVPGRLI
jgi:hypothetical protein